MAAVLAQELLYLIARNRDGQDMMLTVSSSRMTWTGAPGSGGSAVGVKGEDLCGRPLSASVKSLSCEAGDGFPRLIGDHDVEVDAARAAAGQARERDAARAPEPRAALRRAAAGAWCSKCHGPERKRAQGRSRLFIEFTILPISLDAPRTGLIPGGFVRGELCCGARIAAGLRIASKFL